MGAVDVVGAGVGNDCAGVTMSWLLPLPLLLLLLLLACITLEVGARDMELLHHDPFGGMAAAKNRCWHRDSG